jgi:hypothetical protein
MLVLKGVGKTTFAIPAGSTVSVIVRLSHKARRRLAGAPRGRLKVLATASRTDGGPAAQTKILLKH